MWVIKWSLGSHWVGSPSGALPRPHPQPKKGHPPLGLRTDFHLTRPNMLFLIYPLKNSWPSRAMKLIASLRSFMVQFQKWPPFCPTHKITVIFGLLPRDPGTTSFFCCFNEVYTVLEELSVAIRSFCSTVQILLRQQNKADRTKRWLPSGHLHAA